jgi:hypothetical protein
MLESEKAELVAYLQDDLGLRLVVSEFDEKPLPFYLRERYSFAVATISKRDFLLFSPRGEERAPPVPLRQDWERLNALTALVPIWISTKTSPYDRRRLIDFKIPFACPGTQAYLPDLLIDLREHLRIERAKKAPRHFSPTTQRMLIEAIYTGRRELDPLDDTDLKISPSKMQRSRFVAELLSAGLVETEKKGRTKHARFPLPWEEVWATAQPFLRSPVRKRVYLRETAAPRLKGLLHSGLSALADQSDLSPPSRTVVAAPSGFWHTAEFSTAPLTGEIAQYENEAAFELELWFYMPFRYRDPSRVDPLSLYLSLQEESQKSERVQNAAESLLREVFDA